jgi:hypothetical protein
MPDNFTRQGKSAAFKWQCTLIYYFTLSNARQFYLQGESAARFRHYFVTLTMFTIMADILPNIFISAKSDQIQSFYLGHDTTDVERK